MKTISAKSKPKLTLMNDIGKYCAISLNHAVRYLKECPSKLTYILRKPNTPCLSKQTTFTHLLHESPSLTYQYKIIN